MLVFQSIFMNANKYQKQTVLPEIFNLKNFSSKKFYVETKTQTGSKTIHQLTHHSKISPQSKSNKQQEKGHKDFVMKWKTYVELFKR